MTLFVAYKLTPGEPWQLRELRNGDNLDAFVRQMLRARASYTIFEPGMTREGAMLQVAKLNEE